MTTANKPENLKTNEAHDLGQISIKTLFGFIKAQTNEVEQKLKTHISRVEEFELLAQIRQLEDIKLFLMVNMTQAPTKPEIREGMAEFVGPLRRVYIHTQTHNGIDQRTMTGAEHHFFNQRRDFTSERFHTLDAPDRIPAGGHYGRVFNDDDADWNVFPMLTYREWF